MQNSIHARINGRDITFQIEPQHVHGFESYIGKSAYETLRAFTHGVWTVKDIKSVLTFALFADSRKKWFSDVSKIGIAGLDPFHKGDDHINGTLETCPPGTYAELAAAVLTAALFGVKDGENTFTDKPDGA